MPAVASGVRALGRGVLLLMGRTASGKTALAIALAEAFDAEIVGADSRQIYRDMTIGTAAPSESDRARVRHHLVGFLDPSERYSAARFVTDALAAIDDIHARGKRAIVVGGTGFYLRALAGDVTLSAVRDESLRARLAVETHVHPPEVLHAWLTSLAPARAATVTVNDPYRITRALEIALASRRLGGADAAPSDDSLRARGIAFRKVLVDVDDAILHPRIEARVDAMLAAGFVDEAERIGALAVAADAVGYREALDFRSGLSTARELRSALARNTRRYAKRQGTWFRRELDVDTIAMGAGDVAGGNGVAYERAAEVAAAMGWVSRTAFTSLSDA